MSSSTHLGVRSAATAALRVVSLLSLAVFVVLGLGPRVLGYRTFTVLSGSMRPAHRPGDILLVKPDRPSTVAVGDVITFNAPVPDQHVVSHRVIEIVEHGDQPVVRTKGDANEAPDPWAARLTGARVWRVFAAIPALGRVLIWMRHPVVQTSTVAGAPACLALLWLVRIWSREPSEGPIWEGIGPAVRHATG